MNDFLKSKEFIDLIVASGSEDMDIAFAAQKKLALALQEPLRQGVLVGDVLSGVYEGNLLAPGATPKYTLDILAPGEEGQYVAYTIPKSGRIPNKIIEGDYVLIPTYRIGNSIDWQLTMARDARYDVVSRAMEVLYAGFIKKMNDDGFHTLLAAGVDRNVVVYDGDASAGQFTKRLVELMRITMIRNGGGNTGSIRRARLTDMFVSHECISDIRNWGVDQVDDVTRREIFLNNNGVTNLFGVNLRPLDELGEDNEYQLYFTSQLAASMAASDVEIVVGLDLSTNDSFVMPIRENVSVVPDPTAHRNQMVSMYGWAELGFGVLDGRRVLIGSL